VALGRGGLSFNYKGESKPDTHMTFDFSFSEGSVRALRGWGVLRWNEMVRDRKRAGLEFSHLDEDSRSLVANWLRAKRPNSFIPKDSEERRAASSSPA